MPPTDSMAMPPEQQGPPLEFSTEITPEEQEQYGNIVAAGMKILYSDETSGEITDMIKSSTGDPAGGIGHIVSTIIGELDKQSGGKIPEVLIFPVAAELLAQVGEMAQTLGMNWNEQLEGLAMQQMVQEVGEMYDVTPEDVQAFMQSIPEDQMQEMIAQQDGFTGGASPEGQAPGGQPAQQAPQPGGPPPQQNPGVV